MDFMLGRLCRWLRLLGEDAEYYKQPDKSGILYRSLKERRTVLTRDRRLAARKAYGIQVIMSEDFREQLKEVSMKFSVRVAEERIYTRCTECNSVLKSASGESVRERVPEYIYRTHDAFSLCPGCGRVYWKGTHRDLISGILDDLRKNQEGDK